jgi:hypothetical protein
MAKDKSPVKELWELYPRTKPSAESMRKFLALGDELVVSLDPGNLRLAKALAEYHRQTSVRALQDGELPLKVKTRKRKSSRR